MTGYCNKASMLGGNARFRRGLEFSIGYVGEGMEMMLENAFIKDSFQLPSAAD